MASTTFSGPVTSTNGFVGAVTGNVTATTLAAATAKLTVIALASLPAAAAGNAGTIYFVSGTSSGNTLVFSNGSANIDLVTGVAVVA
jgi:hypothetical protein